jgi:hypothetical protein
MLTDIDGNRWILLVVALKVELLLLPVAILLCTQLI